MHRNLLHKRLPCLPLAWGSQRHRWLHPEQSLARVRRAVFISGPFLGKSKLREIRWRIAAVSNRSYLLPGNLGRIRAIVRPSDWRPIECPGKARLRLSMITCIENCIRSSWPVPCRYQALLRGLALADACIVKNRYQCSPRLPKILSDRSWLPPPPSLLLYVFQGDERWRRKNGVRNLRHGVRLSLSFPCPI